jgi:FkbM family methyltransferase
MFLLREGSHSTDDPLFVRIRGESKGGKEPLLFPEAGVARWFYESGMAEKNLIEWVRDTFVREDKAMLDIGAHVGTYSWMCGKKAEHVYAFECSPKTFCYLAANIALHGLEYKISPFPFALGDAEGELEYIERSADGGGNGVKQLSDLDDRCQRVKVRVKTLDSFGFTNIGFIKIDVEGFEKEVLTGAQQTLKDNGFPPILFESWGDWKEATGVPARKIREELFAFLNDLGYKIVTVSGVQDTFLATHT